MIEPMVSILCDGFACGIHLPELDQSTGMRETETLGHFYFICNSILIQDILKIPAGVLQLSCILKLSINTVACSK